MSIIKLTYHHFNLLIIIYTYPVWYHCVEDIAASVLDLSSQYPNIVE